MWKLLRNLVLVAILLAGVLKLVLWYEVRQNAARLVSAWAPYAQVQYDSVGVGLDGTIGVGGVNVAFGKGPSRSIWRASQVDIETSGPFWLLRRTLLGDESFPARLGVSIKGLQPPAGASPFDWHWLSPLSLVPFETFGCGVVSRLSIADYQRMGLNPGVAQQRLEYRFDAASNSLTFAGELSTPPFSAITLTGELQRFDARALTLKTWPKLQVAVLTAEYADSGYLAKRNRFCAQQAGANPAAFVDQHINAIKSYLDGQGVQTMAGVETVYRELVTNGGRMSVQSLPSPGFTLEALSSAPPDVLVRQLNLTTRHNDAPPVMLRLAFKTTSVADDTSAAATAPPAAATATPANNAIATSAAPPTPPALPNSRPAVAAVPAAPVALPPAPPAQQPAPKPTAATPPPAAAAHAAPPAATVAATPAKPQGAGAAQTPTSAPAKPAETASPLPSAPTPPEGSTLALVWKPEVDRLPETAPPVRDYDVIAFGAANTYAGRFVRVLTSGGKKVEGRIIGTSADGTTIALRVSKPGGTAELQVQRSVIVEIQMPHQRAPAASG